MEEKVEQTLPRGGAFRCLRCGSVTWGNLHFCSQCGEALDAECQDCGKKWRYIYDYIFCPSCGARLKKKP